MKKTKAMMLAALFAALTAAVAPLRIPLPFTPVPITLQTLMVLLAGAILGARIGALSQVLYLAVGALGLPVFAGGGAGLGVLFGPTGGFLLSYPIAAWIVGYFSKRKSTNFLKISGGIIGILLIVSYVDLIFNLGIMKVYQNGAYIPITSVISTTQKALLIGFSALFLGLCAIGLWALTKKKVNKSLLYGMGLATIVIYLMGAFYAKITTGLPWPTIALGWILPFIIGDIIKCFLAAIVASKIKIDD